MDYCATSLGIRENRCIYLFREVGPNLRNWGSDTVDTYIGKPLEQGNPVKAAIGTIYAGLSGIFELSDYALAGVIDQPLEPTKGLRTIRDIGQTTRNLIGLRIPSAVLGVLRLPGSLMMDTDKLFGFDHAS